MPIELHERLRLLSVKERKSLGQIISDKFEQKKTRKVAVSPEEKIRKAFALFDRVAKSSRPYDAVKAVREERDRDNA